MTEPIPQELAAVERAWSDDRSPLSEWVLAVCEAFRDTALSADVVADAIGSTTAELEAVLRLGTLDPESLSLVSQAQPPITTWILLSQLPVEAIPDTLDGIANHEQGTAFESAMEVVRRSQGKTPQEKVSVLAPELFKFAASKAERYNVWSSNGNVKALKSFASYRRTRGPLTPKQTVWALNLLRRLVETRAIQVPSPDGDDEKCRIILDSISGPG